MADYARARLATLGRHSWRHKYSNIVVFDRPPAAVVQKWRLAIKDDIAHLVAMSHITREQVDRLAADLAGRTDEVGL